MPQQRHAWWTSRLQPWPVETTDGRMTWGAARRRAGSSPLKTSSLYGLVPTAQRRWGLVPCLERRGESWSIEKTHGLPAGNWFTSLACPTSSECWLSGNTALANPIRIFYQGGVLLSSANGGRNWSAGALPKGVDRGVEHLLPGRKHLLRVGDQAGPPPGPSETPPVFPAAVLLVHEGHAQ